MCFDKRKTPVRCIMCLSICAVIASIVMIIFAALITNSDILDQIGKEDSNIKDAKNRVFIVLLIFALSTLLIGGLGFCFKCIKNRCFAFLYGLILLPTWLAVLIIGFVAVAAAAMSETALTDTCNKLANDYTYTYSTSYNGSNQEITYSFDIYESIGINKWMCTNECVCEPNAAVMYSNIDFSLYKSAETRGNVASIVTAPTGSVATYKDCIANAAEPVSNASNDDFKTFAKSFRSQTNYEGLVKWMDWFEDTYDCAGICKVAAFYWTKNPAVARPSQSCISSLKEDITTPFLGLGIATVICGILLFFIFIMQYCLWRSYD